jgi:hypothetical protein
VPGERDAGSGAAGSDGVGGPLVVTRRVVLRRFPAIDELHAFAVRRGGQQVGAEWIDRAQKFQHRTAWRISSNLELWYIDDNVAGCGYVRACGPDAATAGDLLRGAEGLLDVWTRAELLHGVDEAAASNPIEHGLAVMRLGVSAPADFDEEIWDIISSEFYNDYEETRDMAVWACTYAPYPQYRPDLEEVVANDPNEKVSGRARMVLGIFDALGIT